jgi:hypothetical protein
MALWIAPQLFRLRATTSKVQIHQIPVVVPVVVPVVTKVLDLVVILVGGLVMVSEDQSLAKHPVDLAASDDQKVHSLEGTQVIVMVMAEAFPGVLADRMDNRDD